MAKTLRVRDETETSQLVLNLLKQQSSLTVFKLLNQCTSFTSAVLMTNITNPSKNHETTDKDNLMSNGYKENATRFTEYPRINIVQRTNMRNNISEIVTTDNVLTNKTATTITTSTIENISTTKDTNLNPSKSNVKFDPMAALISDLVKTKKNFNQNQCKGVYEPVLISAGLMKAHLPSDTNVSQKSTHEPSAPKGIKLSGNSNAANSNTNSRKESERGNINQYDNAQTSESENKIDYYGDAYYDEAYYGYYDDYYYNDEPGNTFFSFSGLLTEFLDFVNNDQSYKQESPASRVLLAQYPVRGLSCLGEGGGVEVTYPGPGQGDEVVPCPGGGTELWVLSWSGVGGTLSWF